MRGTLISILEGLNNPALPVRLQGSLGPKEAYPPAFFTYWNVETPEASHYDNKAHAYIWRYTVYFYATDPTLVDSETLAAIAALEAAGWIIDGKGYDVPSDEITHTGRAFEAVFVERPSATSTPEPEPTPEPDPEPEENTETENTEE